jgi:hypothetical protein
MVVIFVAQLALLSVSMHLATISSDRYCMAALLYTESASEDHRIDT